MDRSENNGPRINSSRIQMPKNYTSMNTSQSSSLAELSDSQSNTRSFASSIPAPSTAASNSLALTKGTKREVPAPAMVSDAKRKTVSDRAGQVATTQVPPISRSRTLPTVRATSLVAAQSSIQPPSSRQASSSASTSVSSRATSVSSFASSCGPGARPPHTDHRRSQSNYGRPTNTRGRPPATRPKTSFTSRRDEGEPDGANGKREAWDLDTRLGTLDSQFQEMKKIVDSSLSDRKGMDEELGRLKEKATELEVEKRAMMERFDEARTELATTRAERDAAMRELETEKRAHMFKMEDLERQNARALDDLQREVDLGIERARKAQLEDLESAKRRFEMELEDERRRHTGEIQDMRARLGNEHQDTLIMLQKRDCELGDMKGQIAMFRADLEREQALKARLQDNIDELSSANLTLEAKMNSLKSQLEFLESDSKAQSDSFAAMEERLQQALRVAEEARSKLIKEETERRILFNKYQELKGNIRVMCRVRPMLDESEGDAARYLFPDEKTSAEIQIVGPEEKTVSGQANRKNYNFDFDRVFTPDIRNDEIFGEISQLVQSALDGYNVCIFCYGQTGSGKTFTMSSTDGMIPRATKMIYDTITKLKEKSWTYTMEGSFVEVYNEDLHDLLVSNGRESDGRKKLEIRHDDSRKQTTVVNCRTVRLDSAEKVEQMLAQAQNNRSVAATKANERSSRSHSVFILKLVGENATTRERCEGTLNLVDLAGSERLKHSQAEGDRMKETQSINKSLSCLGDVIEALGKGSGHIPYRNSKLTHLLQYSLGGNSKTLMFVMVSPLEVHLRETLTSLRFATKVHNTHIGTAKATKKVKDKAESV